jgi:hypothetical protein
LQVAGVDEVEWLGVFPFGLKIVHLKGEIRGDPGIISAGHLQRHQSSRTM